MASSFPALCCRLLEFVLLLLMLSRGYWFTLSGVSSSSYTCLVYGISKSSPYGLQTTAAEADWKSLSTFKFAPPTLAVLQVCIHVPSTIHSGCGVLDDCICVWRLNRSRLPGSWRNSKYFWTNNNSGLWWVVWVTCIAWGIYKASRQEELFFRLNRHKTLPQGTFKLVHWGVQVEAQLLYLCWQWSRLRVLSPLFMELAVFSSKWSGWNSYY